ncbi:hypothetical protein Droror1_Dr00014640 [Drosera rotundifolia]
MALSGIWMNRNAKVHDAPIKSANVIFQIVRQLLLDFRRAQNELNRRASKDPGSVLTKWSCPAPDRDEFGFEKCYNRVRLSAVGEDVEVGLR